MPTDIESNEIKKSMAYDLIDIIESAERKDPIPRKRSKR